MDEGVTSTIVVDRSSSFNPSGFLRGNWRIAQPQDGRSLSLREVDVSKICLVSMLRAGERSISGQERLQRLQASPYICLDAKVLQAIRMGWRHIDIPERWKEKINGKITYISFDGTRLIGPWGNLHVLCLGFHRGRADWYCRRLKHSWDESHPSAVLEL